MFMRLLASAAWLITHFFPRTDSKCLLLRWILTAKSCPAGLFRSRVEATRKSLGLPTVHAFPAPGLRTESGCTSPQELTNFISGGSVFPAENQSNSAPAQPRKRALLWPLMASHSLPPSARRTAP